MHTRSAKLSSLLILLAGFTVSACSAFFVPDVNDDGVSRCNTTEDCESPEDNRHIAQCVYGEAQPENSEKVCSSAFKQLNCNPQAYGGDHPLVTVYEEVTSNQVKAAYGACADEFRGMQGCAPLNGVCNDGLELIEGVCDDPDALYPALNPSQVGGVDIAGQDVIDQFCRFYFCDDSFVCDTSGTKWLCKPCDPNEEYGTGGCGSLYLDGAPSTIYTDPTAGNCEGAIGDAGVEFGAVPIP
jgi:hypothetical protein